MSAPLVRAWYQGHGGLILLSPLAALYRLVTGLRRLAYRRGWLASTRFPVPVIVVGNITVGGTGKTPLTAAMVAWLQQQGRQPAIVSRGYGGKTTYPALVTNESTPTEVGDEPLMLFQQTGVPVVIDPVRSRAVAWLLEHRLCDVVVCDDGLQHYALARDIELVVLDGSRGIGNGKLLPQGPLREDTDRLAQAQAVVVNGSALQCGELQQRLQGPLPYFPMGLKPGALQPLHRNMHSTPPPAGARVHAVAGIGHPERFFGTLRELGYDVIPHPFPDHHHFHLDDLYFSDEHPVVMTAKDAVKCAAFRNLEAWVLPVTAELDPTFFKFLEARLSPLRESAHHAG